MPRKRKLPTTNLNRPRCEIMPQATSRDMAVPHDASIEEVYGWGSAGSRPDLTRSMRNQNLGDGSWQSWVNDPIGVTGNVDPTFGTSRRLPRSGELVERALAEEARLRRMMGAPVNATNDETPAESTEEN